MPYPNEHSARIADPDDFVRIVQLWAADGIRCLGGPLKSNPDGPVQPQSYRFDRHQFTPAQAREWLRRHNIHYVSFEEATGESHSAQRIDAQRLPDGGEADALFSAQGRVAEKPPIEIPIPADILARIKQIDPEPFLVAGLISRADTIVNGVHYTKEFLKELLPQIPVVQHPEHLDRERGAFARRPAASYMLAAALTPDGNELWGVAWIPQSNQELLNEVKSGFAVGIPPAWSTECFSTLIRQGDHYEPKPGTVRLLSIDWVEPSRPGVPGAGPKVLISAQNKEESMPDNTRSDFLAALTLEELRAARSDLVDALLSSQKAEIQHLQTENDSLKKKVAELEQQLLSAQLQEKRQQLLSAVKNPDIRKIADRLLSGQSVQELEANWQKVREEIAPLEQAMPLIPSGSKQADKPFNY
ncbi:MAG: hypothetical protein N2248_00390 [candidate division WOR-3 bacterium]|nr:hypothetical protein [candidate division WOR-3 bacterium]